VPGFSNHLRIIFGSRAGDDFLKSRVVSKRYHFQRIRKFESAMHSPAY
jgi:hypothetical protein